MSTKLAFASRGQIGLFDTSSLSYLNSQYLMKYKSNLEAIQRRNEWKAKDISKFALQPSFQRSVDSIMAEASITGLSFTQEGGKLMYSVSIENMSGIFIKTLDDDSAAEGHVLHNRDVRFQSLDYSPKRNEMVFAVREGLHHQNLAIMGADESCYREITGGESADDNPVWSQTNSNILFFDSAGLGTNASGFIVGLGPKSIFKFDTSNGHMDEIVSMEGKDCLLPKVDGNDNVYFIAKPYSPPSRPRMTALDVLLLPYRLLKAVFSWLNFFTTAYTGESLTSGGPNPAKSREADPKMVLINDNIINAEKTLKESRRSGEKYPGIAPKNWVLMKLDKNGTLTVLKKGVLDFDVSRDGDIVYSNGKYLIRLDTTGEGEVIERADLLQKIKIHK
jgi:hypothetical protein